jgi:hypothetical protein
MADHRDGQDNPGIRVPHPLQVRRNVRVRSVVVGAELDPHGVGPAYLNFPPLSRSGNARDGVLLAACV